MIKITDPEYFLPKVHALSAGEIMKSGANMPQLIRGVCAQTGEKSDYIVKYMGAERMHPGACAKELIGACIANQINLNVPDPAQILVSDAFVETLKDSSIYAIAARSIGQNYGSCYIGSAATFLVGQSFNEQQLLQIPNIFAFDMFIQNADRNNNKPNMISDGALIYLFDHEMAFGYADEILPVNNTPWILRDFDMKWISAHIFYPHLRGKNESFNTFAASLDALNDDFWGKLEQIAPTDWKTDLFYTIVDGLKGTVANKGEFINQLKARLL